jgi:predicted metal-binding membrane protein
MALMAAATMVAMMLPSIAPTLWRYHRNLRSTHTPRARERTLLLAAGYAAVWTTIGCGMFAMSAEFSRLGSSSAMSFAPWVTGVVVLCGGLVQGSPWKMKMLIRCRRCVSASSVPRNVMSAWHAGCGLGVDCALSCAAPMAILFAVGLMDMRMMLVTTAAITAERVAPNGVGIARATGAVAAVVGLVMCIRAIR